MHVYEMYWSDLLRLKPGLTRILGELYQTLFHLCQVGRQTVDFAFASHADERSSRLWWQAFGLSHRWAVRILTLAVPIYNLFLLAVLLLVPLGTISDASLCSLSARRDRRGGVARRLAASSARVFEFSVLANRAVPNNCERVVRIRCHGWKTR